MVGLTGIGVLRVESINDSLTTINDLNAVKQRYAINFRGSVHDRAIALRDVVLSSTPAELEQEVDLIAELADKYSASAGPMDDLFAVEGNVNADEVAVLADIKRIEAETLPLIEKVVELERTGQQAAALQVLTQQAKPLFVEWLGAINVLIDMEEAMNADLSDEARGIASGFLLTMVLVCAAAAVLAVVIAWRITRGITRPLAEAETAFAAVA